MVRNRLAVADKRFVPERERDARLSVATADRSEDLSLSEIHHRSAHGAAMPRVIVYATERTQASVKGLQDGLMIGSPGRGSLF
jgi:hypothetical protein